MNQVFLFAFVLSIFLIVALIIHRCNRLLNIFKFFKQRKKSAYLEHRPKSR